jgi:hypothetical protein
MRSMKKMKAVHIEKMEIKMRMMMKVELLEANGQKVEMVYSIMMSNSSIKRFSRSKLLHHFKIYEYL